MKKVEEVNKPWKLGERYLVPCIVNSSKNLKTEVTPVINHPHNDKENGQEEVHYHVDYRFVKHKNNDRFPTVINNHSRYRFVTDIRPVKQKDDYIMYFELPVINEEFTGITPVNLIAKSKLKHKCIHKGKCPHRGYDLSQVKPMNGRITCPLHGLEFDNKTKKVLNH